MVGLADGSAEKGVDVGLRDGWVGNGSAEGTEGSEWAGLRECGKM